MEIDPYAVLRVLATATPLEIKKSYKKLCLEFHPDKIQQLGLENDNTLFPQIQFAYSILSDASKRSRYDATGSLGLSTDETDGFDWKKYFQSTSEKITIDMIEEDRAQYQGSREEKDDILENFAFYDGDFLRLFEVIPHLEFDEAAESRIFAIVEEGLESGDITADKAMEKSWLKYKKSRKTKVRQMLKKLAKEAKQAEDLEKKLKKPIKTENDLKAMIQKKNSGRMDDLIASLESKYAKKGKKNAYDIDDAEFERIQKKMRKN